MKFEQIKSELKKEFIGIDEQIDNIIDLIRPWYNNPDLYDSPCVINLWGMTGQGKTSLVNRIIDMLGEGHNRMYMNCHSMVDMDLYFMESFVEDTRTNNNTNKFIIFDDFQYVRTIDEDGNEHSSSALSIMWNLMDTGIISNNFYASHFKIINNIRNVMSTIDDPEAIIGGVFVDPKKYIPSKYFVNPLISPFDVKSYMCTSKKKTSKKQKDKDPYAPVDDIEFFLDKETLDTVCYICRQLDLPDCESPIEFISSRSSWDALQWKDFFDDLYARMKKGKNMDFHNSLIFIIGNLDEAFSGIAKDVNPEMSADAVHEITSKVNIVDIKQGLQCRFRNEQIARLGNTHIIYPSLSADSYVAIIKKHLDVYTTRIKEKMGIELIIDPTVVQCIYNEGVFPTQGVRPLFSTINDIVKSNIPKAIDKIACIDKVKSMTCRFDKECKSIIINVLDHEGASLCDEVSIPVTLRVRGAYKDTTENIANTSVHESGHYILYKYLTGCSPIKVVSRSLEQSCLGYMMEQFDDGVRSKHRHLNEMVVCLGGYAAEQLVFGMDFQSTGASSDIENATAIASSMINEYGLSDLPICRSVVSDVDNEKTVILTEEDRRAYNRAVSAAIANAFNKAKMLLTDNAVLHACFKDAFTRLNAQGELTDSDIKEISAEIEKAEGYAPISGTYYADKLKEFV